MNTKALCYCFAAILLCTQLHAQKVIVKQRSFGSPDDFDRIDIKKTVDGGLVMCRVAFLGFGNNDYYLIKFDSLGRKQKELTLGSNGNDRSYRISPTRDHGYIVAGLSSYGISGDKTEAGFGSDDYWIVKLDSLGNIQWDKTIGSNGTETGMVSIDTTLDGGYIAGGTSNGGVSGYKTSPPVGGHYHDYWVVKLDSAGNVQWDKTVGGTNEEFLEKVKHTSDGGYILGGNSSSYYSGNYGQDYYIVKLDANGNEVWEKRLSGKIKYNDLSDDDNLYDIIETTDGGFLAGGQSESLIGIDKTDPNTSYNDIWLVKLDGNGNKLWDKTLGGNDFEDLCSLANTADGGYVAGISSSSGGGGEKTELSKGNSDYWIVKLNSNGDVKWDKTIGGNAEDDCSMILEYKKNEYVLGGTSQSGISGDRTIPNKGSEDGDFWIVGLKYVPETNSLITDNRFNTKNIAPIINNTFKVYPNPAKNVINVQAKGSNNYSLVTTSGKTILSKIINGNGNINVSQLPAGVYYLQNITAHTFTKVVVTH